MKGNCILTKEEAHMISLLEHRDFNVSNIERHLQNPSDSALDQNEVKGFMKAIRQLLDPTVSRKLQQTYTNESKKEDILYLLQEEGAESIIQRIGYEPDLDKLDTDAIIEYWEHLLGFENAYWNSYWSTCADAIVEVLKK